MVNYENQVIGTILLICACVAVLRKKRLSSIVCLVAGATYWLIAYGVQDEMSMRSLDWIITCPFLLMELVDYMECENQGIDWLLICAIIASVGMNLCGFLGDRPSLSPWQLLIGFCGLGIVLWTMYKESLKGNPRRRRMAALFLLPWILYGIIACVSLTNSSYSYLDLYCKGAFSLFI